MNLSTKSNFPILSLYGIVVSILISPFVKLGYLQLWMIIPFFFIIINLKYFINNYETNKVFYVFYFYTLFSFCINIIISPENFGDVFLKQLLFTSSFFCFLLVLSYEQVFSYNFNKLLKFLNVVILIVCIYGIYQSFGRVLGLPLTGNEYLNYRTDAIAGLIQISSFFEEPAFFSQFLLCAFFIHAFVLNFKYKLILILIIVNLILTISVSGYLSLLVLIFFWLGQTTISKIIRQRINLKAVIISILMIIPIIILIQSDLFSYIFDRFSSIFKFLNIASASTTVDISVDTRTNGEFEFITMLFSSNHFLSGFGINYNEYLPGRTLALNVITEILVRWGLIGLILFGIGFTYEISAHQKRNILLLYLFLILYFSLDGAIAKPSFWVFLGLVFLFNRLNNKLNVILK